MLEYQKAQTASDLLWELWLGSKHIDILPQDFSPENRAEGYSIQRFLEQRSNEPLCGWKIAATSQAGQSHIGVSGPMAGRLLKERFHSSGKKLSLEGNLMKVAEAEFAFQLGSDLPLRNKNYNIEEVLAAVDYLHPAIEIPDSRFNQFAKVGEAQLIADNACAHEFVLGEPTEEEWRDFDLQNHSVEIQNQKSVMEKGTGRNVLGDPRIALTWLVNELLSIGIYLKKGQVVTTGTITKPIPIAANDIITANFGQLGSVTVGFSD